MATIFAETIARAISEYRQMLRRYLSQSERVTKLAELNLKDTTIYQSEISLYNVAHAIIEDIESNMKVPDQGYYSYSGIMKFCEYLKEYINNYEIEDGKVIHHAQKASKALIQAIQIATLPAERLDEKSRTEMQNCNELIARCGSPEQQALYLESLERSGERYPEFYAPLLKQYQQLVSKEDAAETEAADEDTGSGGSDFGTYRDGERHLAQDVA